jgi:hypothetical protein
MNAKSSSPRRNYKLKSGLRTNGITIETYERCGLSKTVSSPKRHDSRVILFGALSPRILCVSSVCSQMKHTSSADRTLPKGRRLIVICFVSQNFRSIFPEHRFLTEFVAMHALCWSTSGDHLSIVPMESGPHYNVTPFAISCRTIVDGTPAFSEY